MNGLTTSIAPSGTLGNAFASMAEEDRLKVQQQQEEDAQLEAIQAALRDVDLDMTPGNTKPSSQDLLKGARINLKIAQDAKATPEKKGARIDASQPEGLVDVAFIERIRRRALEITRDREDLGERQAESASKLRKEEELPPGRQFAYPKMRPNDLDEARRR